MASLARSSARGESERERVLSVAFVTPLDLRCGEVVGPVIGPGRLSVASRYEDWLLTNGAHPWMSYRYEDMSCAEIPERARWVAGCIELSDTLLQALDLVDNSDSFLARLMTSRGSRR